MHEDPKKEHEWLKQLVGEWTYEHEASMGPGEPPVKCVGTESVRAVGDLWVVCEGRGEMPNGGVATTIMTLGYDAAKQRYAGTFIGSMMTHLWVYDGQLEAGGSVLTLDTEGPTFTGDGKTAKYRDSIEVQGAGHRTLTSRVLGDDGRWTAFMTARYRRR
jgi:hypothetical protein